MFKQDFWKDKRVLITGHTGFKGSWLSIWLKMMGAEVIGYALQPNTEQDNFVLAKLDEKIVHIIGDVRDCGDLLGIFKKYEPEFVFHLAAQPLVRESYGNPKRTFDVNVAGTVNLFECCRLTDSVRVIVNITSDKCYENKEWLWGYRENDRLGGYDPYSASKAASEIVTTSYRNSYFHPERIDEHGKCLASVRAGNVIGGGDWQADRLIPDCVRSLEQKSPIIIRSPEAIRPWQHVLEPLHGYLLLASKMTENPGVYCDAWNFGPKQNSVKSVGEVVDLVVRNWGAGSWQHQSESKAPHEANILRLDIAKASMHLGWNPIWDIEESVDAAMGWYKNYRKTDVYEYCGTQIDSYMKKVKASA